jgi:protein-S-isoprenylcysteine O-methyltransferase Ste14
VGPTIAISVAGSQGTLRLAPFLLVAGIAIALGSDWMLVLVVPAALILHFGVVKREERYLEAKFGESYRAYMERVPRYWF